MSFYDPNIPAPNDFLTQSQQDIQNNFQQLDTSFGLNHFAFSNGTANNGKHSYIEMVNRTVLPSGLADEEGTIYTKKVNGESQMFYSPDNTSKEYQVTNVIDAEFSKFSTNTNYDPGKFGGWTYLPGGLIFQYGLSTTLINLLPINFPIQFPNNVFSINIIPVADVGSTARMYLLSGSINTSSFSVTQSAATSGGFYWQAIGN